MTSPRPLLGYSRGRTDRSFLLGADYGAVCTHSREAICYGLTDPRIRTNVINRCVSCGFLVASGPLQYLGRY